MSLPILDPKKVPDDWETDIFGLVHPPLLQVTFLPLKSWGVYGDGTPMTEEEVASYLDKWKLEPARTDIDLRSAMRNWTI